MKKNLLVSALVSSFLLSPLTAGSQETQSAATSGDKEKRMEWFADAKLGICIHWGIYSVKGVSESWSFFNNYLPYPKIRKQSQWQSQLQ